MDQVTVRRELLRLWAPIAEVLLKDPHNDKMRMAFRKALDDALEQPARAQEPDMHEAMCPALTGGKCNCPTSPVSVDKAWAQFYGGIGRGPDAPYPGMIEAFEAHYAQPFTDRDWRNESGVWAAAWKACEGLPTRLPCEVCGAEKTQAHHAKAEGGAA